MPHIWFRAKDAWLVVLSFVVGCHTDDTRGAGSVGAAGTPASQNHGGNGSTSLGGKSFVGGTNAVVGGAPASGGTATLAGGTSATGGSGATTVCRNPNLVWKSANKTNYTSYPDPGSEECVAYNGCTWAGQFAACDEARSEDWVASHNIVAAFPDFASLKLHDLCLRKGAKLIVVTVLDTCADSDCSGCCTQNTGSADQLIDIEGYTDARWGVPDGPIEWADLGPTIGQGCN